MDKSEEINSHSGEHPDNTRILVTGAELQTLVATAVATAMEKQFGESSGTQSRTRTVQRARSKTHSKAHSKPPSKKSEPKKAEEDNHSSNHSSVPKQEVQPKHDTNSKSYKINSHPMENNDNARINLTGAELKALVDDAVKKALERQYEEYSGTRSRTLSIPHSMPPSKKDEPKKEDDERHPSNNHSDPSQQIILNQGPHDKGCSYNGCAERDVVKFVSQSFKGEALAWWRSLIQATGKIPLYNMTWDQFVTLIKENYCPQHEVEKIEAGFISLVMTNLDCQASAADLSLSLTLDIVRGMAAKASENGKRKREDENSRRSDRKSSGLKRDSQQSVEKTKCETCRKYHLGKCRFESQPLPCGICKSQEHKTLDCEKLKDATCYGCNERGHVKTNCPKNQKKPEEAKRTNA
ncbi:uncharacterized protein LOC110925419 [Helianthus annuus]|uniref:uncharacterized protein LOC110925419 n=2 Tax=Helianthus annuus TaxID=4232 RepID=UPI000B8F336E|nr:uncharacterized protein LOC110925419 [Helianthus annuus]